MNRWSFHNSNLDTQVRSCNSANFKGLPSINSVRRKNWQRRAIQGLKFGNINCMKDATRGWESGNISCMTERQCEN